MANTLQSEIWNMLEITLKKVKHPNETIDWTRAVIQGLTDARKPLAEHYGIPWKLLRSYHHYDGIEEGRRGEHMLDFTWTTYPDHYVDLDAQSSDRVPYEIILAAESEWGVAKDSGRTFALVMDDFCKLLDVKARAKVMVYGWTDQDNAGNMQTAFMKMLARHRGYNQDEDWLFIGIPWWEEWNPLVHILQPAPTLISIRPNFPRQFARNYA